jgi:hypothetical protein
MTSVATSLTTQRRRAASSAEGGLRRPFTNNKKLRTDLAKLADRPEPHRYVFFMSPVFPDAERRPELETGGVQVWSTGMQL